MLPEYLQKKERYVLLDWMKRHSQALLVSTFMFALMAAIMAGFMVPDDEFLTLVSDENLTSPSVLWTWRIGGLVTWPVFMWLMLRPYVHAGDSTHRSILIDTLITVALYGGVGLWITLAFWRPIALWKFNIINDPSSLLLTPLMLLLMLILPFVYTWGFVAQYGVTRDRLASNDTHDWISCSLRSTAFGFGVIGIPMYLALYKVLAPLVKATSIGSAGVSGYVTTALFTIAFFIGNFASQWYAFYCMDEWFDAQRLQKQNSEMTSCASTPFGTAPTAITSTTSVTNVPDEGAELTDTARVPRFHLQKTSRASGSPPVPDGSTDAGSFCGER